MVAISVGELEATIRLKDQLTAELRKVVGEIGRAGSQIKQVGEKKDEGVIDAEVVDEKK